MALNFVDLPLTVRGEGRTVASSSGLNWGHRTVNGKSRNPNEAYINVPASIRDTGFFPPPGQTFSVSTDDDQVLKMHVTGRPPKNLQTYGDLTLLGRYFRRRLQVETGRLVTIDDLRRYGRDTVRFERREFDYLMDFSTVSRPTPVNQSTQMRFEQRVVPADARVASGQGRSTDAEVNRRVELYAMAIARQEMERRGWTDIEDTSANNPYDFTARVDGRLVFVEVKGTQSRGAHVTLTRNEVRHVREHPEASALIVVHSIEVEDRQVRNGSGVSEFVFPWRIDESDLEAVQFEYQTRRLF